MDDLLSNWYLARLRRLAWEYAADAKATPMTMLQTDKELLQKLVAESAESQEERQRALLKALADANPGASEKILVLASIGLLLILLASQFWQY